MEGYKRLKTELIEKQIEKTEKEEESVRALQESNRLYRESNRIQLKYANPNMTLVRKEVKDKHKKETGRELLQEDVIKKMADTYVTEMRAMWPKLMLQGEVEETKSETARKRSAQLTQEIETLTSQVVQLEQELQGLNPVGLKKIMANLPKPPSAPAPAPAPSAPSAPTVKAPFKSSANLRRNVLLNTIKKKLPTASRGVRRGLEQNITQIERTKQFPSTANQVLSRYEATYKNKAVKRGGTRRK